MAYRRARQGQAQARLDPREFGQAGPGRWEHWAWLSGVSKLTSPRQELFNQFVVLTIGRPSKQHILREISCVGILVPHLYRGGYKLTNSQEWCTVQPAELKTVGILLLTAFRFIDGKLLLQGRPLIERVLEPTSSRQSLFDTYYTTVSFIQIMHNPAYLVHHGSTTTKHWHLKCKVQQHPKELSSRQPAQRPWYQPNMTSRDVIFLNLCDRSRRIPLLLPYLEPFRLLKPTMANLRQV